MPAHVQRENPYRRISPPPANNPEEHEEQEEHGPSGPLCAIRTGRAGGATITGQLFSERSSWDDLGRSSCALRY